MLHRGFEICIIDPETGISSPEYLEQAAENTISCYIPSIDSRPYHVLVQRHDSSATNQLNSVVWCTSDGRQNQRQQRFLAPAQRTIFSGVQHRDGRSEPWVFSSVPHELMWSLAEDVDGPWTISLRVQHLGVNHAAQGQNASLGAKKSVPAQPQLGWSNVESFDNPFATFIFRYRPLDMLQQMCIAPVVAMPVSAISLPFAGLPSASPGATSPRAQTASSQALPSQSMLVQVQLSNQSYTASTTSAQPESAPEPMPSSASAEASLIEELMASCLERPEPAPMQSYDSQTTRKLAPSLASLQIPDLLALPETITDALSASSALQPSPDQDLYLSSACLSASSAPYSALSRTDHRTPVTPTYSASVSPANTATSPVYYAPTSTHEALTPAYSTTTSPTYGVQGLFTAAYNSASLPNYGAPSPAYGPPPRSPASYAPSPASHAPSPASFTPSPAPFACSPVYGSAYPSTPLPAYGGTSPPPAYYQMPSPASYAGQLHSTSSLPASALTGNSSHVRQPKPQSPPQFGNWLDVPGVPPHSQSESRSPKRKLGDEELDAPHTGGAQRTPTKRRQVLPHTSSANALSELDTADYDKPCLSRGKQHQQLDLPDDDPSDLELDRWKEELNDLEVRVGSLKKLIMQRRTENQKKTKQAERELNKAKKSKSRKATPSVQDCSS